MTMLAALIRLSVVLTMVLMIPVAVNAADVRSRVLRVFDDNKLLLSVPEAEGKIAIGSEVTLSVDLPKVGPVAITSKWRVESQTGQGLVATPQGDPSGKPQVGYDALISPDFSVDDKRNAASGIEQQAAMLMLEAGSLTASGKNKSDARRAILLWRKAAKLGSTDAEVALGIAYAFGHGVDRDEFAALSWFERAAAKGNDKGQVRAGLFHQLGYETEQNPAKAVRYFQDAASLGNASAMFYLFDAYEDGKGVTADIQTALHWLRKAGDHGLPIANYALSSLHFSGQKEAGTQIVTKDEGRALSYLLKAGKSGMRQAIDDLAQRFKSGDGVVQSDILAKKWSRLAQTSKGQSQANAIDHSNPYCLTANECYGPITIQHLVSKKPQSMDNDGSSIDLEKSDSRSARKAEKESQPEEQPAMTKEEAIALGRAERQERLAAYNKEPLACDKLAAHPQDGDAIAPGVSYTALRANQVVEACLLALSDNPNERRFHTQLARGYFKQGNLAKALNHFQTAATMQSAQAMAFLGVMYKTGRGVPRNLSRSLHWFQQAADRDNLAGLVFAATMLRDGQGASKNPGRAAELLEKAVKRGAGDAYYALGMMLDKGQGVERHPERAAHHLLKAFYKDIPLANAILLKKSGSISRQTRWYIQENLAQNGCYQGKLDGLFGNETKTALQICKTRNWGK